MAPASPKPSYPEPLSALDDFETDQFRFWDVVDDIDSPRSSQKLLITYKESLEAAYNMLVHKWRRPAPPLPINIRMSDMEAVLPGFPGPFILLEQNGEWSLYLPALGGHEPTDAELDQARATSFHELAHVFNWNSLPPHHPNYSAWAWLDEATAQLFQSGYGSPSAIDAQPSPWRLRKFSPPFESPSSLDLPRCDVAAALFLHFLDHTTNLSLGRVFGIWDNYAKVKQPFAAPSFYPVSPHRLSQFHDYSLAALFPKNHVTGLDLYARAEPPIVIEMGVLDETGSWTTEGRLDHLTSHYYRFQVFAGRTIMVSWARTGELEPPLNFRITLVVVEDGDPPRKVSIRDYEMADGLIGPIGIPFTELWDSSNAEKDGEAGSYQLVLVVSNCGVRSSSFVPPPDDGIAEGLPPHDDWVAYSLRIEIQDPSR